MSARNPNVLFELGIRQAFDKPVVLIQEKGTPKIFDIAPLRVLDYSKEMKYHEVLKSQGELTEMINATKEAEKDKGNVNSIVRLLALSSPAAVPQLDRANKESLALEVINSQMNDMRKMLEMFVMDTRRNIKRAGNGIIAIEYEKISSRLDKLERMAQAKGDSKLLHEEYHNLIRNTEELMMNCDNDRDLKMIGMLMDKVHRQMKVNELM